ncbi:hypothetical protein KVR01_012081 [Diaporthe batatas]|uniref:uncharacterized protein n=1 Tax=Diaporthe batatas TaxID=748121 RepID=UPI001D053A69|nr:uncharacterized protein KVR01_012081 [Diaporthe batatas]KAG8158320.1 hypothetical protein KVR01_012081 [Diaporthe batatas]
MRVSAILVLTVMAFQANALGDKQTTNQEVTQTGGEGGSGGDINLDGGNGGDGPTSTGGDGGDGGDASGGQGTDFNLTNQHTTQGGAGGTNSNGQATECNGSCVTYVTQSSVGANGGAAADYSNVQLQGPIANTDSSGGSSVGGNGGESNAEGDGGAGSQNAESTGGDGGDGNQGGTNEGGSNENSNSFSAELPVKFPFTRRYQPGAYEARNAGI